MLIKLSSCPWMLRLTASHMGIYPHILWSVRNQEKKKIFTAHTPVGVSNGDAGIKYFKINKISPKTNQERTVYNPLPPPPSPLPPSPL
jgi:hypothetical protein